jgi:hypothetical protein
MCAGSSVELSADTCEDSFFKLDQFLDARRLAAGMRD